MNKTKQLTINLLLSNIIQLLLFIGISAQSNSVLLSDKIIFNEEGKWYTVDELTNKKFEINTRSMTVKLREEKFKIDFENLCDKYNVTIENENVLGYYDLILPDSSKFYDLFSFYEDSRLFSSIEIFYKPIVLGTGDPGYSDQYYLDNNDGFVDINISTVFDDGIVGSPSVIIAIIDEGVDDDNTDLDDHIWSGYGWDYIENDSNPDPSHSDEHHGTVVAGIIAAETDNGLGISGIAGGDYGSTPDIIGCSIMSLRVLGYDANNNYAYTDKADKVDDAIIFAANNGAKIINMSIALDKFESDFQSAKSSIDAAIEYAYNTKGCLLIAPSGNDPKKPGTQEEDIYYPARNPLVMAVGGLEKNGSVYGRVGNELEITGPAASIHSLLNTNSSTPADYCGLYGSGTSFSTAQASGVAALIFSEYSDWINFDVRKILNESADDLGNPFQFGNGLLQADEALTQANPNYQALNKHQPQNVTLTGAYGTNPVITWDEIGGNDIDDYNIYRAKIVNGVYTHFSLVASVYPGGNSTNSWTDNSVVRQHPRTATSSHYYRVTSIDVYGRESLTSDEVSTTSNWMNKSMYAESNKNNEFVYSLGNNYPNPFNPSTRIRYSLKNRGHVSIQVYDVLGRLIEDLVNDVQDKGNYEVTFNSNDNLTSGIYYYTMKVNDFCTSKKLVILK